MAYSNSIIFGPVPSRRFGISLGVDLSPSTKQCNFDCLYCELEKAKTVDKMTSFPSVSEVISAIKEAIAKHSKIDVITITANGEPTLYPNLPELIDEINKIKGEIKTMILSNGSTIYDDRIYKALLKLDTVKLSLDCVSQKCFKKLDRIHSGIDIEKMIESMISFRKETKNRLVLEILFVKTLNDKEEEINLLYKAVKAINPHRVDIGTIDRPPAYEAEAVSFETLEKVANTFEGINVNIAYKNRPKQINSFDEKEIKALLTRRPLTSEDVGNMFDEDSKELLKKLVIKGEVKQVDSGGLNFYKIC
ncbi:radical SAM protein [Halarcobacter ebronensis]|uniref:Radical SAM protein n=1 Tax=Halarcobacter ebronensis TaxID=1462615 RepID=A0A4Q0YHG6_9BACT|nr:radical SAM protein [Halarcobacter ebronensis]RXJ69174.1 radical SAM protein [Halarcobacter ebronensis]